MGHVSGLRVGAAAGGRVRGRRPEGPESGTLRRDLCRRIRSAGLGMRYAGHEVRVHTVRWVEAETGRRMPRHVHSLGFLEPTYFCRRFRAVFRCAPLAYRAEKGQDETDGPSRSAPARRWPLADEARNN